MVGTRHAEHGRRQRAGEGVVLEEDQVGPHLPATSDDVVGHVGRGDLAEQARDEVVVDALRSDPVSR